jgi:hypothetical protein
MSSRNLPNDSHAIIIIRTDDADVSASAIISSRIDASQQQGACSVVFVVSDIGLTTVSLIVAWYWEGHGLWRWEYYWWTIPIQINLERGSILGVRAGGWKRKTGLDSSAAICRHHGTGRDARILWWCNNFGGYLSKNVTLHLSLPSVIQELMFCSIAPSSFHRIR